MSINVNIGKLENLLYAEMQGVVSVSEISEFFTRIFLKCEEFGVDKVLVEAFTNNATEMMDKYAQLKIFEQIKFKHDHRIAWVNYNPKTIERSRSTVLLLKSRGIFVVEIFEEVKDGLSWLLNEEVSIDEPVVENTGQIERLLQQMETIRKLDCHEY